MSSAKDHGDACEDFVVKVCKWLGYSVYDVRALRLPHDLVVNGARVQVKQRRAAPTGHNPGSFYLKIHLRANDTAYPESSIDAFVFLHYMNWYVVPSSHMSRTVDGFRNGILISEIAEWRNRWDVLDGDRVIYAAQKCFDF
jgi:hypothetical protein